MNSELHFFADAQQRPRLRAIAQAALMLTWPLTMASVAHAATTYLPPCDDCILTSGPLAGDEWVIQGNVAQTAGTFISEGTLTNQANVLTNQATMELRGPYAKLVNQKKLINDQAIWLTHPNAQLVNQSSFLNNGSINIEVVGVIDNAAGQFVNAGIIKANDRLHNRGGAQWVNQGQIELGIVGHLENEQGAVLQNSGSIRGVLDARVSNHGTIRNLAGGMLSHRMVNTGTIINEAGGTMSHFQYHSMAGSTLVNRGLINGTDSTYIFAAGSHYDFTGGTLINGSSSRLLLNRDFTFGAVNSGTVELRDGSLENNAHIQIAKGHTQHNGGEFYNRGQFTNHGTFTGSNFFNRAGATTTNHGDFLVDAVNQGSFVNHGSLYVGPDGFLNMAGATLDNRGSILPAGGVLLNAGTIHNTGTISLDRQPDFTGGTLVNGRNGLVTMNNGFTLGADKSGTLVLEAGGKLVVHGSLTNLAGHTQINSGDIAVVYAPLTNEKGATFVNNGTVSIAGHVTQRGKWIGTGTFEHIESGMDLTGLMVQDKVKFGFNGTKTISQGGVLTTNHLDSGMATIRLNGGTINSPNEVGIHGLRVEGDGGLINANVRASERLLVTNAKLVINGNLALDGFLEQTGENAQSSFHDLVIGASAYVKASGDIMVLGDLINGSTFGQSWSTTEASVTLLGQGSHVMALAGQDLGATSAGLASANFAWQDIVF